ncbi:acyltransferase family protein [Spongiactinospora sp. TRM90649]|uniref:acyltransferase family protein n=1 Tax=Spongiactinospora sp. TRM90649 TaxID=3031114 RepID=UPI0023F97903|nr:acyltransferase family protein [Spongiactinospora sp. TRM90649]MDF5751189.1 acyltransferase family protein [Spongiactinospora sp. TRM90649]
MPHQEEARPSGGAATTDPAQEYRSPETDPRAQADRLTEPTPAPAWRLPPTGDWSRPPAQPAEGATRGYFEPERPTTDQPAHAPRESAPPTDRDDRPTAAFPAYPGPTAEQSPAPTGGTAGGWGAQPPAATDGTAGGWGTRSAATDGTTGGATAGGWGAQRATEHPGHGRQDPLAASPPTAPGGETGLLTGPSGERAWKTETPDLGTTVGGNDRSGRRRKAAAAEDGGRSSKGEAARQEAAGRAGKKREPYLDNVKFLLITVVVMGHSLVPTLAAGSARAAYLFIYSFHMPLFVLISGYLSRNFWNSNAKTNKLVDTFLIPYVIVEVGYAALRYALGSKWSLTIIDPAWLNWYLLALLLWRLSTPVWRRMKQPLLVALAIYLLSGFSEISGDFSFDRFFGLLPFFVIGLMLKPEHFDMLNRLWIKLVAAATLAAAAVVAIVIAPHVKLAPIYFKSSYHDLKLSWWMGLGLRTALLAAALAMSFAVLALVPRRQTWYTDLGTRTLYAYLLHGVPVLIAKEMGWLSFPWMFGPLGAIAIMSICFTLAIVLCLPETRTLFKWIIEPRLTWLYRRPAKARTASQAPAARSKT